jgi:hypothetical protein
MNFIKARQDYKCHDCKDVIKKNDKYNRRTIKIGKPIYKNGYAEEETVEKINGTPVHVGHVFRMVVKLCAFCAQKEKQYE